MPRLIINHGIQLELFIECFVNNVHIGKDEAMYKKEKIPPPLVLTHPVVNSIHIPKVITDTKNVHVMIIRAVNIQTKK